MSNFWQKWGITGIMFLCGQVFNFAFQFLLFKKLGNDEYGRIGLAYITFLMICFVADLGYTTYFLRAPLERGEWVKSWRISLGHRVISTIVLDLIILVGWYYLYGKNDEKSFGYLLLLIPATFFYLINISSSVISSEKYLLGSILRQSVWPMAVFIFTVSEYLLRGDIQMTYVAGGSISLAYFFQAIGNIAVCPYRHIYIPSFFSGGYQMLKKSFRLASIGLISMIGDRLPAYLISLMLPKYLAIFILLSQVLNGLSGLVSQLLVLIISGESNRKPQIDTSNICIFGLLALNVIAMPLFYFLPPSFSGGNKFFIDISYLTFLNWVIATICSFIVAVLLGRHKDFEVSKAIFIGVFVSVGTQLIAFWFTFSSLLFIGRLAGSYLTFYICLKILNLRIPLYISLTAILGIAIPLLINNAYLQVFVFCYSIISGVCLLMFCGPGNLKFWKI